MLRQLTACVALAAALTVLLPQVVFASPTAQQLPGESNLGFLLAGFAVVWVAFFAYVFYTGRRQRELRHELEEMKRRLTDPTEGHE